MLNKFNFEEILNQAKNLGIPVEKKRNILREYLQSRFLEIFYSLRGSHQLIFIGGTCLRLLHNLDRFSEDLDFDNCGLSTDQIKKIIGKTIKQLEKESFIIESSFKKLKKAGSFRIKFLKILSQVKITSNPKEKLMIKFDYTNPDKIAQTKVFILSRFGVLQRIPSYSLQTLLSYKFKAVKERKRTMIRDFYDLAWLLTRGIKPNLKILKIKREEKFYQELKRSFLNFKAKISLHKKHLLSFLINKDSIRLIDLFEELVESRMEKENPLVC